MEYLFCKRSLYFQKILFFLYYLDIKALVSYCYPKTCQPSNLLGLLKTFNLMVLVASIGDISLF